MNSEPEVVATESASWPPKRVALWVVTALLALAPAARMMHIIGQGSRTQFADYWMMVPTIFRSDGWLSVRGLFELRNEHPIAGAKVVYWLNYKISGGSNIFLGYIVVAMVIAMVVFVGLMLRRHRDVPDWGVAIGVVLFSVLAFARQGGWNFTKAMSGTAWLGALLFVIIAVYFERSERRSASLIFGVFASLTYGTGLVVWPVLVLMGWIRDRTFRNHWRPVVVGAAVYLWYMLNRKKESSAFFVEFGFVDRIERGLITIGSALGGDQLGFDKFVGAAILILGIAAAGYLIWRRIPEVAPWIGLFAWGLLSTVEILMARIPMGQVFSASRYHSLGTVMAFAVVVMAFLVARDLHARYPARTKFAAPAYVLSAVCAIIVLVAGTIGTSRFAPLQPISRADAELLGVALRVDAAHGGIRWTVLEKMPPVEGLLRKIGHYPFDGRLESGCGMIGKTLSSDDIAPFTNGRWATSVMNTTTSQERYVPAGQIVIGRTNSQPNCVVITDSSKRVIGAGATFPERRIKGTTWNYSAVAKLGADQYRVYLRYDGSPKFHRASSVFKR